MEGNSFQRPGKFDGIYSKKIRVSVTFIADLWRFSPWRKPILFLALILSLISSGFWTTTDPLLTSAVVNNNGVVFYGDSDNLGQLKFQTNSYDYTFNGENAAGSPAISTSTSAVAFLVAKAAPTRNEAMIGQLKVDGRLDIIKGVNGFDAAGDFAAAWNHTYVGNTMTCSGATAADCTRSFDLAYEQLGGRTMVVYAGDSQDAGTTIDTSKLFYCYWDGTNWGPVSNCAPTTGVGGNEISLTSSGRPIFVETKAQGGSNKILLVVSLQGATHEAEALIWDGSSWGSSVVLTDTTNVTAGSVEKGNSVAAAWESISGDAFAFWGTAATDTNVEVKYKKFSGGSWGSEADAFHTSSDGSVVFGINADSDPSSNRIAVITNDSVNDISGSVWKADGSTAAWDDVTSEIGETTIENQATGIPYTDVIWQKTGNKAIVFSQNAANTADPEYSLITCNGSGCTASGIDSTIPALASGSGGPSDDGTFVRLANSPNSNDIMALYGDIDGGLFPQHWDGTSWEATALDKLEANLSGPSGETTVYYNMPATFLYQPYNAWSLNWRFYSDITNTDPSTGLGGAAENVAPTGVAAETVMRLRINVTNKGAQAQIDARKKLQYTSGCNPNSAEGTCTWNDVGDTTETSATWRYATTAETCAGCADGSTSTTSRLTGTDESSPAVFFVADKDAAADADFDHSAVKVREIDFPLKAENVAENTTYYFRLYDVDQGSAVMREQDNDGANDCSSSTCTYPSLSVPVAEFTVSGTVYMADETTPATTANGGPCDGGAAVISVRVDGGTATTTQCSNFIATLGQYSITLASPPSAGSTITIYLTSTMKANTVYITDGSADTGIDLFENRLSILHTNSGPATIPDLIDYDSDQNNTDMLFDAEDDTTDTLAVESGNELHVPASMTFAPGGNVTAPKLHLKGTYTGGSESLTLNGSGTGTSRPFYVDSGTFTPNTNTTVYTGTAATDVETTTYNNLQLYPSSGSQTFTLLSGTLNTANLEIGNGSTLTVAANTNNPTINVSGNLALNSGVTYNKGSGTTTLKPTGTKTWTDNTASKQDLGTVTIGSGASTPVIQLASSVKATSLTISASHELDANGTNTLTLTGTGTPFTKTGTYRYSTGTIAYSPATTATITALTGTGGTDGYYNLTVASGTATLGGNTTINNDLTISGGTLDVNNTSNYSLTIGGGWNNSGGTFTARAGTVTFNATDSGNIIAGTMTGSSAFYKVVFNGTGGAWTIQSSMTVSQDAASAMDLQAGTVTFGDGPGDNLEVKNLDIASTAEETAVFQTAAISQDTTGIIIDINTNNSGTPPSCTSCAVTVGASTGTGSGSLKLAKNTLLRLNPYQSSATDIMVTVNSTGYLEILGSQDATGTSTSGTNESSIVHSGAGWSVDQHNGKNVRMTSGLARGRIYDITDTTTDTLTYTSTQTSTSTMTVSGSGNTRKICAATGSLISSDNEFAGRFIYDQTGPGTGRLEIIDSTDNDSAGCGSAVDSFTVIGNPDALTIAVSTDTFSIVDGVLAGDQYEILDYAAVSAETGLACNSVANETGKGEAYIYGSGSSQTLIRYGDICNLGRDATQQRGLFFTGVNGGVANNGAVIDKSRIRENFTGIYLNSSAFNNTISDNYIADNLARGVNLNSTSSANTISGNIISNNATGGVVTNATCNNNDIDNNRILGNSDGILLSNPSYNNVVTNNRVLGNTSRGIYLLTTAQNNIHLNNVIAGSSIGILSSGNGHHNTFKSNEVIGNTSTGITLTSSSYGKFFGNSISNNPIGLSLSSSSLMTNTKSVGDSFANNSTADIATSDSYAYDVSLFDTSLGSTTEVSGFSAANGAYVISKNHDNVAGATAFWGSYAIPADQITYQDERVDSYSYTTGSWTKSSTHHGYFGAGTVDGSLSVNLTSADLSGGPYVYTAVASVPGNGSNCILNRAVFDLYRNNVYYGDVLTGTTSTDPLTGVRFDIDCGSTPYNTRDTYSFVVWNEADDTNTQKIVSAQQDGDTYTVPTGRTINAVGQSSTSNKTTFTRGSSGSSGWHMIIAGTINASNYTMSYLGGSGGGYGLDLQAGATVTDLSNGTYNNFQNTGAADSYIRVDRSLTNGGSPIKTFGGVTFTESADNVPEYTITANSGTAPSDGNYWLFNSGTNCTGWSTCEASDLDSGDGAGSPNEEGFIRFAGLTIQGTVYGTDETNPDLSGALVRIKISGAGDYSINASGANGSYSIDIASMSAGAPFVAYLDTNGGISGATYSVATGSSISSFHIYRDRITTRCDNSCSLTNTDIDSWDKNDDTDIHATVASSNLTVDGDWKLLVAANTFAPGGTVTTTAGGSNSYSGDLEIKSGATLNMSTHALSLGGSYNNGGTATLSANTTTFAATGSGKTLAGSMAGGSAFNNLSFNGASGAWTMNAAVAATGNFDVTNGAVTASNNDLSVTGNFTLANTVGVDYVAGTSNVTVGGNWSDAGNKFTEGTTSTVTLNGTGSVEEGGSFAALSIAAATKTTTFASNITVANGLTLNGGTATASGSNRNILVTCDADCTPVTFAAATALNNSGGTVGILIFRTNASNATTTVAGGDYGSWPLRFQNNASGLTNPKVQLGGHIITSAGIIIHSFSSATTTTGSAFETDNYNITASNLLAGDATATLGVTSSFGSSTITLTNGATNNGIVANGGTQTWNLNTSNWLVSGNFSQVDGTGILTMNADSSTVDFTKTSATQTLTTNGTGAGKNFYNLYHSGNGTLSLSTNDVGVNNDLLNSGGTISGSVNVTVNGSATGAGAITLTGSSTFELRIAAAENFGTTSGSNAWSFVDLTFSNSHASTGYTVTTQIGGTGAINVSGILRVGKSGDAAVTTLDAGNRNWTLSGTGGDPFQRLASPTAGFTANTSTLEYTGNNASGQTTVETATYYKLTINNSSETFELSGTTTVSNNLLISAGVLDTVSGSNHALNVGGNFTNNGTFTARSGTVTLNGASTQTLSGTLTGSSAFYDLVITNNSGTSASDNERTDFVASVDFDVAATITHDYTITTANVRVEYNATSTYTIANINWNGQAVGSRIYFRSSTTNSSWLLNVSGTQTAVSYVNVSRSNANGGDEIIAYDGTNHDGGNNPNWLFTANTAPNSPTSLTQKKVTGGATISTGGWTNETQVQFTALADDTDNPDTLYLCVEAVEKTSAFSNTETSCGSGGNYSGSAITVSVNLTGLTDNTEYKWQVRVKDAAGTYSNWAEYDTNGADRDFGVDTTAPTGGTVYDGTVNGVDGNYNNGDLDTLSANWASFDSTVSGISKYEYAIGTTAGGTDLVDWTNNTTSTSVTASSLNLRTNKLYYFSVRATDNAGNAGNPVNSNGQFVNPEISFSLSSNAVTFANLNDSNDRSDSKTTTLQTSTNAYGGYVIRAYASGLLASGSKTIPNFSAGSYASPSLWPVGACSGSSCGFGYTSSDTTIGGSNKFGNGTLYAPFSLTPFGDVVADHTDAVDGSTGKVVNEQHTITYKVAVDQLQDSSSYQNTIYYIVTGTF